MNDILKDPVFLMKLLETMAEGLMVVDKEGNILYINPACETITGYKKEEVIGKQCTIFNTSTCVITTNNGKQKKCSLFNVGCVSHRKCEIKRKDGKTVHILKNAVILDDSKGNIIGAVEVMTDITSLYIKEIEINELKQELSNSYGFMGLIGNSTVMKKLYEQIENASKSDVPVIISGESGTGKELVAEAIHRLSNRKSNPFIKVNCAALNEFLLESELFGHVKGAFTGAIKDRTGRFEAAQNGSIFLDEIGDMPLSMQVKLLRVLQEKEIERVGDHKPIKVNVRVIAATNKNLFDLIQEGKFREDLFYRINVIPINTPSLKHRKEDIPLLINHFLKRCATINNRNVYTISPSAMEALEYFDWPGNVRQLINTIEYALMTAKDNIIKFTDLPEYIFSRSRTQLITTKKDEKKQGIIEALNKHKWNRSLASRHLGISRVTLWKLMKELGIESERNNLEIKVSSHNFKK